MEKISLVFLIYLLLELNNTQPIIQLETPRNAAVNGMSMCLSNSKF